MLTNLHEQGGGAWYPGGAVGCCINFIFSLNILITDHNVNIEKILILISIS